MQTSEKIKCPDIISENKTAEGIAYVTYNE
jgi:hypothetical protein